MSNIYIKDFLVRLAVGLPIRPRDVEWLVPTLEGIVDRGTYEQGYEEGYAEAAIVAETQVRGLLNETTTYEELVDAINDFEVDQ